MGWEWGEVRRVVVRRGEMLEEVWWVMGEWYGEEWLVECGVLVVSEGLGKVGGEVGWEEIKVGDKGEKDGVLGGLE